MNTDINKHNPCLSVKSVAKNKAETKNNPQLKKTNTNLKLKPNLC